MYEDDVKEIKIDVKELLQRSAVHNSILQEHKNFSLALQAEQKLIKADLVPIKSHVHLMSLGLKMGGLVLVGFLVQALVKFALH